MRLIYISGSNSPVVCCVLTQAIKSKVHAHDAMHVGWCLTRDTHTFSATRSEARVPPDPLDDAVREETSVNFETFSNGGMRVVSRQAPHTDL